MAISDEYKEILNTYEQHKKSYHKFLQNLKKLKGKDLDNLFIEAHEKAFNEIDCLNCGNCCRTTSPVFKSEDIQRLANHFRIKPGEFIDRYLHIDEDFDYVLNYTPCPFLGEDNYCSVYENRPNACRSYPHTNHRKMYNFLDLTRKNAAICPAVVKVLDNIYEQKI